MKGIAKISFSIALATVILLSLVVASVAWFTSNSDTSANNVTMDAAKTLTVAFESDYDSTSNKYGGQLGNAASGGNAPYVCNSGGFNVAMTSLSSADKRAEIKVEFGTVTIETHFAGYELIPNVLLTDLFHVEASIYVEDEEGDYVKDGDTYFRSYVAATDSELTRYSKAVEALEIGADGTLMDVSGEEPVNARFEQGSYTLSFTFTFLPEDAYQVWEDACAGEGSFDDIEGFELSQDGDYIGVVGYTPYVPKYHYGLQRYARGEEISTGVYAYAANNAGGYVRVVTDYKSKNDPTVKKYDAEHNENENGAYIKVEGSNEYILYSKYNRVNGFPYSEIWYSGAKYTFTVSCTIEEVDYEA